MVGCEGLLAEEGHFLFCAVAADGVVVDGPEVFGNPAGELVAVPACAEVEAGDHSFLPDDAVDHEDAVLHEALDVVLVAAGLAAVVGTARSSTPGAVIGPLEREVDGDVAILVLFDLLGVTRAVDLEVDSVARPHHRDGVGGEEHVLACQARVDLHLLVALGDREAFGAAVHVLQLGVHVAIEDALVHDAVGGDDIHVELQVKLGGHVGVVVTGRVVVVDWIATHHHEGEGQRHQDGEEIAGHDDTPCGCPGTHKEWRVVYSCPPEGGRPFGRTYEGKKKSSLHMCNRYQGVRSHERQSV